MRKHSWLILGISNEQFTKIVWRISCCLCYLPTHYSINYHFCSAGVIYQKVHRHLAHLLDPLASFHVVFDKSLRKPFVLYSCQQNQARTSIELDLSIYNRLHLNSSKSPWTFRCAPGQPNQNRSFPIQCFSQHKVEFSKFQRSCWNFETKPWYNRDNLPTHQKKLRRERKFPVVSISYLLFLLHRLPPLMLLLFQCHRS